MTAGRTASTTTDRAPQLQREVLDLLLGDNVVSGERRNRGSSSTAASSSTRSSGGNVVENLPKLVLAKRVPRLPLRAHQGPQSPPQDRSIRRLRERGPSIASGASSTTSSSGPTPRRRGACRASEISRRLGGAAHLAAQPLGHGEEDALARSEERAAHPGVEVLLSASWRHRRPCGRLSASKSSRRTGHGRADPLDTASPSASKPKDRTARSECESETRRG